jgi:hypothetical protein
MRPTRYTATAAVLAALAAPATAAADPAPFSVQTTKPTADIQSGQTVIPAGSNAFSVDDFGNVLLGPNELLGPTSLQDDDDTFLPDFAYKANARRLYTRSLVLTEVGDPVDLSLGRVGPPAYPLGNRAPEGIPAFSPLGAIYFRGWTREGGFNKNRSAQISSWSREDQTRTAAGGDLRFFTTPQRTTEMKMRMVIEPSGGITIHGATSTPNPPDRGNVVLYVDNNQLMQMDWQGRKTPLEQPAATSTTNVIRETAAPDPRVATLQQRQRRTSRQLAKLRRTVRRLAARN